jgi:hypothetical protein
MCTNTEQRSGSFWETGRRAGAGAWAAALAAAAAAWLLAAAPVSA